VGTEGEGFSRHDLDLADLRVKIPLRHGAESLNVAVASGILLYEAITRESR
jgi:TrmH family RNA methyltransferase